jgi:hypothetical protein
LLSFSIALVLAGGHVQSSRHPAVENRGKLGTWYWASPGANAPVDEDMVQERLGDHYVASPRPALRVPASSVFGPYTSVQVNVDAQGHNILGDAANEPSLAVDPTNRNHIVVGWRQFDNVTSNFRQAGNGYSLDGGLTWRNHSVFTPGTFRSDPVLASDSLGNFFYNSLQQTFYADVFYSSTSGVDYILKGPATGGDKQWMACDQTQGPGRGFLYESWSTAGNNYSGRQFSRSVNGGNSWLDPINIPGSPIWGTLDVASNGALYLCGLGNSTFSFCRSSDAQIASQIPTFDRVVSVNLGGAIVTNSTINPAGLLGQTWIATDKSKGPYAGNIYMLCSVGVNTANPCQVNFTRSTNGGLTWSTARTLNTDPTGKGASHWFGTLSVAPNGRIDVCWFDNRANPAISNSALFYTSSYDGGTTWTPNVQLSPYFNPNIGYPNQNKMGDYLGMVSDSKGANIAYAATFNGEEDIWFLRVPGGASQATNATLVKTYQGVYNSGVLSSIWNADGSVYSIGTENIAGLGTVAAARADFKLPANDVAALSVRVKATTTITTTAMVWLWNWDTQRYDVQATSAWTGGVATDSTFSINGPLNPYVDKFGNVRCIVRFLDPTRNGPSPYTATFDVIQLLFG